MKSIEDLKLVRAEEEVKKWVRNIYFTYEGEEQFVCLVWEEDYSYEIWEEEFTPKFREALDAWHETTDGLFESMLDDLTWQHIKKGN